MKKIVAIGGGENGRVKSDGTKLSYETRAIDAEIVKLTEKENPNFLFLGHAQIREDFEMSYYETMKKIYGDTFHCHCEILTRKEMLSNNEAVLSKIEWADIIYVGGGDTVSMMQDWFQTGFDKILYKAWNEGKVMCGISAGANCWFKSYNTNSPSAIVPTTGLGFIDVYFTPHCNMEGRLESAKQKLKENYMVGLLLSNCSAIEIINDSYRIITSDELAKNAFAMKAYWGEDNYITENINTTEFKSLKELLERNEQNHLPKSM